MERKRGREGGREGWMEGGEGGGKESDPILETWSKAVSQVISPKPTCLPSLSSSTRSHSRHPKVLFT